jgi:hypothetical protein
VRRIVVLASIAIAFLAAGVGIYHHLRGARFQLSMTPRAPLSFAGCQEELRRFGYNPDSFDQPCQEGAGRSWYHAIVRNTGHRDAWVGSCTADALDDAGRALRGMTGIDVPMWITRPGVGARPRLSPGQSASLDWFAPAQGRVDHYVASCSVVIYSTPPT